MLRHSPNPFQSAANNKERYVNILTRIVLTIVGFILYGWADFMLTPVSTVIQGQLAGHQFDDSNTAYVTTMVGLRFFQGSAGGWLFVIFLAAALAIWWGPAKKLIAALNQNGGGKVMAFFLTVGIGAAFFVGTTNNAYAYYSKEDYTEAYTILPNESAFWIPDVGANKGSQAQFNSIAYLQSRKIAMKRFIIPHQHLQGSGAFWDYYVPTGRLIIVDRSPYFREWTMKGRGTHGSADEAFHCQSQEGVNITAEVAIASSVQETDAAKFLYNFGVQSPGGNRWDPNVIFRSVYYGRTLANVMDTVVRGKVSSLVCREFSSRTFDQDNASANKIMTDVQSAVNAYLQSVGITLDYIGWAGTFTFDTAVQDAINKRLVAQEVGPYLDTLERIANLKVKDGLSTGLSKGMPSTLVLSGEGAQAFLGVNARSGGSLAVPTSKHPK